MAEIRYFQYRIPESGALLVGNEKREIQETIENYGRQNGGQIEVPDDSKIEENDYLSVRCALEYLEIDRIDNIDSRMPWFEIRARKNASLTVHPNAFRHIEGTVQRYPALREGRLFRFDRGLPPVCFLPEYVMSGLQSYPWSIHDEAVRILLDYREPHIPNSSDMLLASIMNGNPYFTGEIPEPILDALGKVDRREFLPGFSQHVAYIDRPAGIYPGDIGEGWQTCSQPSAVAYMAHLLELEESMRVLEVGAGCGYSAAVTARLIGENGHLVTVERIPSLMEFAMQNLDRHFGLDVRSKRIEVVYGDGSVGYEKDAPYDRIFLTAGVNIEKFDPAVFAPQLHEGGILLAPQAVGPMIKYRRKNGEMAEEGRYNDMLFVPLRGKNS